MNGTAEGKLRPAAFALLAVGLLNTAISAMFGVVKAFGDPGEVPTDPAEAAGYQTVQFAPFVAGPAGVITTIAAFLLLNNRARRFGQGAAALALVPGVSCCFIAGIPVGVWVLIVLAKPEVRALFEQPPAGYPPPYGGYGPPPPPRRY